MTKEEFQVKAVAFLQTRFPNRNARTLPDFSIELSGPYEKLFLGNLYDDVASHGFQNWEDTLLKYIGSQQPAPEQLWKDWEIAKPHVLPKLIAKFYLEQVREAMERSNDELLYKPFVGDLLVSWVVDQPEHSFYLTQKKLEMWGKGREELTRVASENLKKLPGNEAFSVGRGQSGRPALIWQTLDSYDATRILLPNFYELASQVLGEKEFVVGVPNRDFLIAVPLPDAQSVAPLVASDFQRMHHQLTPKLLFVNQEGISVWEE